jgi:hypothetical protein
MRGEKSGVGQIRLRPDTRGPQGRFSNVRSDVLFSCDGTGSGAAVGVKGRELALGL